MADQLIIRLGVEFPFEAVSWIRIIKGDVQAVATGTLQEVATQVTGLQVIVLVPATQVVVTKVSIPTQNRQRLLKAIPFALEEQFASDVDDLHFAIGPRDEAGNTVVAVVEIAQMEQWQAAIKAVGLQPHFLIPEFQALASEQDAWHVLVEHETTLIRGVGHMGFAIDTINTNIVLPLALHHIAEEDLPGRLVIYDSRHGVALPLFNPQDISDEVELEFRKDSLPLLEDLAVEGVNAKQTINLLQGLFSRSAQLGKLWRPWRFAAGLALVWLVIQFSVNLSQSWTLEHQSQQLKQQAVDIYKQAFPEARKVPRPRKQMERKLAELRGGDGDDSQTGFLNLLNQSGKVLQQTPALVLHNVRYKKGELNVEIEVPSLQVLDEVKQQLAKQKGMVVEIQSAAAKDDKVEGRLQIKRSGS